MAALTRCILLCLASSLSLLSLSVSAEDQIHNVRFHKGESSGNYSGHIKGYDFNEYVFYAKKNQALTATLHTKSTKLWIRLLDKDNSNSIDLAEYSADLTPAGQYILPYSGKYSIRVGQHRAFARRGEQSNYQLTIHIH